MQSKTSYFSKTIYQKNMTHYWPVWTAYLLVCLYQLPLRLHMNLSSQTADYPVTDFAARQLQFLQDTVRSALAPTAPFLFALVTAMAVFSYLYTARSANMMHAFPVCRESLYLTNLLSGLTFLILPQIAAFLGGIFVCFAYQVTQLEYLMHWLLLSTGMVVFAFALAVFTAMLTGHIIAVPALFLGINFLFVACRDIVSWFVEELTFGISYSNFSFGDFLSPFYYLGRLFSGYWDVYSYSDTGVDFSKAYPSIGLYFAAGLVLFFLAFLVYKKKHLETSGDIVAIPLIKPLFRWVCALYIGGLAATQGERYLFNRVNSGGSLWSLLLLTLPCITIAFFLVEMLLQKNFRIFCRRLLLECGVMLALIGTFLIGIDLNMLGLENRVPAENDIKEIFFYGSYPMDIAPDDFSKVISIHKKIISSKEEIEDYFHKYKTEEDGKSSAVEISYLLKNNKTLKRTYRLPVAEFYLDQKDSAISQIQELSFQPDYYLRHHFTDAYASATFTDGTIDYYAQGNYLESTSLNQEQCSRIYTAFQKDVLEGNYRIYEYSYYDFISDKIYYNTLYLNYFVPKGSTYTSYEGKKTVPDNRTIQGTSITLTTSCTYTLAALEELGLIDDSHRMITQQEADMLSQKDDESAVEYH